MSIQMALTNLKDKHLATASLEYEVLLFGTPKLECPHQLKKNCHDSLCAFAHITEYLIFNVSGLIQGGFLTLYGFGRKLLTLDISVSRTNKTKQSSL